MKTSKKTEALSCMPESQSIKKGPSYKVAKWTLPNANLKKRKRKTI